MKKYTICVVGCGSIGALKHDDIDSPGSENILTHCHAVSAHPRTELMAVVDTDLEKSQEAAEKWNAQIATESLEDFFLTGKTVPDIVIVATPTDTHYGVLHQMIINNIKQMPKLIIAEKPFCSELNQARSITKSYSDLDIPIVVDYIRRFSKGHQDFKALIDSDKLGKALNCRVLYTRGLFHEGCHAIDLMRWFFGECMNSHRITSPPIKDRNENDTTFSQAFWFDKCSRIVFQPCDGRCYGIFEIDMCFEKGRFRFIDNGLFLESYPITETNEWGHKSLNYNLTSVIRQETGLNIALYNLIDTAVKYLDIKLHNQKSKDLICTADDAIKVHEILEELK